MWACMIIGSGTPHFDEAVIESRRLPIAEVSSLSRFIRYEIQYRAWHTSLQFLREERARANFSIRENIGIIIFIAHY